MGKVTALFYGALIVFVALDAMLFGFVPSNVLPIAVIIIGVLVLFTPIHTWGPGGTKIGAPFQWLRRWVFGAAMIIIGAASSGLLGNFLDVGGISVFGYLTLDSFMGQLVLLIIGAIYFLASFARTRKTQVASF